LPANVQLAGLGIEVDGRNADEEVHVYAGRRGAAGCGFGCYAADGGGAEEVSWCDEVVGVPLLTLGLRFGRTFEGTYHVFWLFREKSNSS
jgi:hypothetical protein